MKQYTIYTYTIINVPTQEFKDKVPYVMAVAQDDLGERFLTRIENYTAGMPIAIGDTIKYLETDAEGNIICQF